VTNSAAKKRPKKASSLEPGTTWGPQFLLAGIAVIVMTATFVVTYGLIQNELGRILEQADIASPTQVHDSLRFIRRAFIALGVLLSVVLVGFAFLLRFTLQIRHESALATQRLGRLARSIQPLSAALEHDPGAVLLVDDEGNIVYANMATRSRLSIEGPLIGKPAREIFERLHPDLREALVSGLDAIVAEKPGYSLAGSGEALLVSSRPISIEQRPHFLYTMRPVTREIRRQELEHWKKLIRVLSHELNNSVAPIVSLMNTAQKLNDQGAKDERLTKIFLTISERTEHLLAFLDSYRSIARLPMPTPKYVWWNDFVAGLRAQKEFKTDGELPTAPGLFDPIQLERVIINALNNAREAGSANSEIELAIEQSEAGTKIEIRDRGVGMSEATLKQATLPFFSTKPGGTGIGLALSREIVEAHGGQLTLANREGGGLTVAILLPPARAGFLTEPTARSSSRSSIVTPSVEKPPESLTDTTGLFGPESPLN
jgi:two-component system, NtrC family, nitrogen regulation sensor histidine kinase NtrY